MKNNKSKAGYYFLAAVLFCYLVFAIFNFSFFKEIVASSFNLFTQIYYVFIIVFVLMVLIDYYVSPKKLKKYLGEKSGFLGWFTSITTGIISTGPIYMWYPLLNDLKKSGMKNSLIAAFLYNRAIKLPLIPIMLHYFSAEYIIILTITMVLASVVQGYLIDSMVKD
jgi:uncharacterized membrane protein YraQ (UPF0718 family)